MGTHFEADKQELYGVTDLYGEEDLFTKITEGMRTATKRPTYQSFFEVQQQAQEGGFLSGLNKLGMTAGGQASGFAKSSQDASMLSTMEDEYARGIMGTEEDIQKRIAQAQRNMQQVIQSNQSTSLTLRQIEEG